jgi:opacity protein-like surface antigen
MPNDIDWSNSNGNGSLGLDDSYNIEGAFGVGFAKAFRAELALGYQKNDFSDETDAPDDMSMISYMVNGYYDIANESSFTPYVLAGLGLMDTTINDSVDGDSDDMLWGAQLGAGVGYELSESVILDLKYKYLMAEEGDFGGTKVEKIGGHQIQLGARYQF